jgi:hypothetical protein
MWLVPSNMRTTLPPICDDWNRCGRSGKSGPWTCRPPAPQLGKVLWWLFLDRPFVRCLSVFLAFNGPPATAVPVFLEAAGDNPERAVRKRRWSVNASSRGAVIQVSTSSGVVRITGIALGWMAPTSAFGSVRHERVEVVDGLAFLTFRTDVQNLRRLGRIRPDRIVIGPVIMAPFLANQMPAKQASGRVSSSANQTSPPSALLNSLNELNGTTQRFSAPSHSRPAFALHISDVGRCGD